MFNNFDFEWFGRIVFSVIEIGIFLAVWAWLISAGEKLLKKVLRYMLRNSRKKAAEARRREALQKRAEYISILNDPDYYGD